MDLAGPHKESARAAVHSSPAVAALARLPGDRLASLARDVSPETRAGNGHAPLELTVGENLWEGGDPCPVVADGRANAATDQVHFRTQVFALVVIFFAVPVDEFSEGLDLLLPRPDRPP